MTALIMLVVLSCLVAGIFMFIGALARQTSTGKGRACRQCRTINPPHARFCGRCGKSLA